MRKTMNSSARVHQTCFGSRSGTAVLHIVKYTEVEMEGWEKVFTVKVC